MFCGVEGEEISRKLRSARTEGDSLKEPLKVCGLSFKKLGVGEVLGLGVQAEKSAFGGGEQKKLLPAT